MKSSSEKSSATTTSATATHASGQPFFEKAGGGNFFEPAAAIPAIQAKMAVNQPGDKFEQEADKMADKVMRMPAPRQEDKVQKAEIKEDKVQKAEPKEEKVQKAEMKEDKVQKAEPKEEKVQKADMKEEKVQKAEPKEEKVQKKEEEKLQRKGGDGTPAIGASAQSAIQNQTTGGGQPLSADVRSYMEPRFGADFSNVRIHNDAEAAGLSEQIGARAFAYQNHIFFSGDQYQPGTADGKQLLAHELTHTIQQGHSVQRSPQTSTATAQRDNKDEKIQRAPAATGNQLAVSSEVVDVSANTFRPSAKVQAEIEAQGSKGLDVRVIIKGLTEEGRVKIKVDSGKNYDSVGKGSMPLLNAWTKQLGGMYLVFTVKNGAISGGYASMKPGAGDKDDWLQTLQKNAGLLGGLGLKIPNLPTPVNKFDAGKLTLGVTNLKVEVGGFVDAQFSLLLENASKPKIDATADINVKGLAKGQLKLDNTQDKLAGEVSLTVNFTAFSGEAKVKYNADGTVDIGGKAAYNANRLSGEIQFVATDLETANKFGKDAVAAAGGKENVQNAAPPAPVPAPAKGKKQRALAATGQLSFNLTKWFAGTVTVVVDGKGDVTVIGKIAPPAEITLFNQKNWEKQIIKFEAKAYYGIPLVGNLNLFANIGLYALAKLGPAKIYNIEILGTYSTDPTIQKNIQIAGSINISAYAGLRLRAEGGAGIELIGHELKFGIGLNADIGVKAYADARPTIGFREPGDFYISGTLEMVAQPMLGLGGDFFIELDSPWWSPAPDKKWTWPLFSKEWPLTDPIGLSATIKDYVLGSGQVPEVEMKQPEFDPSKFMTSMVDDKLPNKSGGKDDGKGNFKEDGSVPKTDVSSKKDGTKKTDTKTDKKGAKLSGGDKSKNPDKNAAADQDANKALITSLDALKNKAPYSKAELSKELGAIKTKVKEVSLPFKAEGDKWVVTPGGKGVKKKVGKIELAMKKEGAQLAPADGEIGESIQFTAGEEGHRLWIDVKGESAEIMLASTPKPLSQHLADFRKQAGELEEGQAKKDVLQSIKEALPLARAIESDARKAASKQIDTPQRNTLDQKIEANEKVLRPLLTTILNTLNIRVPKQFTPAITVRFTTYPGIDLSEYGRQLAMQQSAINDMVVEDWLANRMRYAERKAASGGKSGRHPESNRAQQDLRLLTKNNLIQRLMQGENATGAFASKIDADPYHRAFVVNVFSKYSATTRRSGLAESTATREVEDWMKTQHALHSPDQVAGGRYDQLTGVGAADVNVDIGANWGGYDKPVHLANQLERDVKTTMQRMNIRRAFWRQVKMNVILTK